MLCSRWVSDPDWRHLLIVLPPLSLLVFLSFSSVSITTTTTNLLPNLNPFESSSSHPQISLSPPTDSSRSPSLSSVRSPSSRESEAKKDKKKKKKDELDRSRIAVCLVGGARRFELTGPSIVENVLKVYPNSDLFLQSPLDRNSFKFSLLKAAPRIASVRIFQPKPLTETESEVRVLTARNSPNGIQGLLQYFNLVEGCLKLIEDYQKQNNFSYNWVIRTRVDGYWSAPLDPENFVQGKYLVPPGSNYGGLNDRLGIGELNTSIVALSRLSLIPQLDSKGLTQLNSESAFKAQLTTQGVTYITKRLPFCIVSDRKYSFPPMRYGVPVAAMSSRGPLSGAKCRPCTPACVGQCLADAMLTLEKGWSWIDWSEESLKLCDAQGEWESGWEMVFDRVAGKKLAEARRRMQIDRYSMSTCVEDLEELKKRAENWDAPASMEICRLGLEPNS